MKAILDKVAEELLPTHEIAHEFLNSKLTTRFPLGTYLLIAFITLELTALRRVELHRCTIEHLNTALLIKKARGTHPTVHLEKEQGVQTRLTFCLIFLLAFLFVSFVETHRFSVCSPNWAGALSNLPASLQDAGTAGMPLCECSALT